jgi:hypothetical protein
MRRCLDIAGATRTVSCMNRALLCLLAVATLSACSQRQEATTPEGATTVPTTDVVTGSTEVPPPGASTTVVDEARAQEAGVMALRIVSGLDYSLRAKADAELTDLELYGTDMRNGSFADLILQSNQQFGNVKISAIGPGGERYVLWDNASTGLQVGADTVVWAYEVTTSGVSACAWLGENATMPAVVQTGAC